jgi:gas vesicle protein
MNDYKPSLNNPNEVSGSTTTNQPYSPYSRSTSTSVGLQREENPPTTIRKTETYSSTQSQNPLLARALMGGLIGATVGTLLGLVAGKRTSRGINHAVKGVNQATKTIAGGVTQTAKGVGDAVKSVAEGVNYTVVGAFQDTAEGVNQIVGSALNAVQDKAEDVKQSVTDVADAVKDKAEDAKQSVTEIADKVKDKTEDAKQSVVGGLNNVQEKAEDLKPSDNPNITIAKERQIIDQSPVNTSQASVGDLAGNQTTAVSAPVEPGELVESSLYKNPETSLSSGETNYREGMDDYDISADL